MQKDITSEAISTNNLEQSLISRQTFSQSIQELNNTEQIKKPPRLNSLDVHRGLTMFGMMLANLGGDNQPKFIEHAQWDGLTFADLVFPTFIFIMGMSIPLAVTQKKPIKIRNIIRIIILFLIGLLVINLMDRKFDFTILRIPGVMQRLSICYAVVLLIHWITGYGKMEKRIFGFFAIMSGFFIYIAYMMSFNKPEIGCPVSKNLTQFCNMSGYIDRAIFGQSHMIYPNDPQGPFSNLSAFVTCWFGYYFCLIMKDNKKDIYKTLKWWLTICIILGVSVYPLTRIMPLNKKLYSASFAIITTCISGFAIFLCVVFIDLVPRRCAKYEKVIQILIVPFIWLGRNPLFGYVLHQVFDMIIAEYIIINYKSLKTIILNNVFESWIGANGVSCVLNSLMYIIVFTLICGLLYKKNIFIKL